MPEDTVMELETGMNEADAAFLEKQMEADQASYDAERSARGVTPREDDGRFKSASQGQRAGQSTATKPSDNGKGTSAKPAEATKPPAASDDNSGSTDTTPAGGQKPADGTDQGKQQSRYDKARDRASREWKKINEEKLMIEAERARLTAERQAITSRTASPSPPPAQPKPDAPRYTPEQYEQAAEAFEARGEFELADQARAEAVRGRSKPQGQPAAPADPAAAQRQAYEQAQQQSWTKAKTEIPEILDPTSPVNQQLQQFIKQHPQVLTYSDGPYLAAAFVKANQAAALVPRLSQEAARAGELSKQVESLTAKIKELEALVSLPDGGGPIHRSSGDKAWSDKSTTEMESELEDMIRQGR